MQCNDCNSCIDYRIIKFMKIELFGLVIRLQTFKYSLCVSSRTPMYFLHRQSYSHMGPSVILQLSVTGLRGQQRHLSPLGSMSFNFILFSEKMLKIIGLCPHLWNQCSTLWEILDPPVVVHVLKISRTNDRQT